ncbi:hypothetical protein DFH06DRAFT_564613 [Mycena polygramma]|nr:hypothetical protein DFH06DRAFT_564613 [Mycena polygramma]
MNAVTSVWLLSCRQRRKRCLTAAYNSCHSKHRSLTPSSMPFLDRASNLQINGGNFVDIAGDVNLNVTQPSRELLEGSRDTTEALSSLEFAFGGDAASRRLMGVEEIGQHITPARMLAYDHPHWDPPLQFPRFEHQFDTPTVLEPVEIAGSDRYAHIPHGLSVVQHHDTFRGSSASDYLSPYSASTAVPIDIRPSNNSTSLVLRQPVPTTRMVPEQPLTTTHPCGIRLVAPTPRTPPIDHDEFPLFNYPSTNFERGTGLLSPDHQPFPPDFRGELSSAPIAHGPPWGGPPYGPKTSINVSGNMNNIQRQAESGLNILHRAVAGGAFHDSLERYPQPRCHPETRTEMLQDLHQWSSQTDSGSSILWLHGPAGAGKSAIAQSFCQMLEAEGRLGATFFFKRGDASRGSGNKLFPTIAYQLARSLTELKQVISAIVEDDPSIVDKDLSTQVLKLLIEPSRRSTWNHNLAIIIDGLDECQDQHIQQQILLSLGMMTRELHFPLRILVASRPEPHLQEVFWGALNNIHRPLNINQSFEAVHTYLADEFARIHREHWQTMAMVGNPWPTSNIIEKLTDKSSGYFVYAATVIRFIDDRDFRPTERLDMIMGIDGAGSEAPFAALDQLYLQILLAVPAARHPQLLEVMAVIAAKFNLSGLHIEQLLELQPGDAHLILRHLHSVLNVPQDTGQQITVHHASFLDFLDDPTRSQAFHIGESQKTNLVHHILKALSLDVDPDHVAWQFDQVKFEYVISIQPTPDLVLMLRSFNTDFLVFPNVHHVIRRVLRWLRRCQPLPDDIIQLWEDYQAIVTSGVRSPSRMKLRSEGIAGELEMHRHFPQASAQLVKIMFNRVRQLVDSGNFSCLEAVGIGVENLADMDASTVQDLASSMFYFGHWQGTAARRLIFSKQAVQVYRKLAETDPSISRDLAWSLHNLGVALYDIGQYEDMVHINKEAVELCRKLAETDPNISKDLASSLHNLGVALTNIGRDEDAAHVDEEAVELRRKLAETDPNISKDLASSLHSLGFVLCNTGQSEAAACVDKEAVQLRRKLAETDPTVSKDLASSLHSLGSDLRRTEQYEDAVRADVEAVELRRKLAETDPNISKDLASSLHNLGGDLCNTGQYKDAACIDEEAVQLCRKLAETDPTISKDLASCLHNLGVDLNNIGRYKDAAQAEEEAVQLRRKLAETDPTATKDLASSLHSLGFVLRNTGQYEAAACFDKEAVQLHRKLAETDPTVSKDLASSLHNLGSDLRRTEQYEDAVRADVEAVKLCRKLAETDPNISKDLAGSLHNLGGDLCNTGQYEAAARIDEEAVQLRRKLAESDPTVTKDLASSLHNLGFDLNNIGRYKDAAQAEEEAVQLRRKLAETDPTINLASSLHNLGGDLCNTGQYKDAVCIDEEAVQFCRKLAETDPTVTKALAQSLHNLGIDLRNIGQYEAAVHIDEEAVQLRRKLAETDPTITKALAQTLHNLGVNLRKSGQHEAALRANEEAVELGRKLAETDPTITKDLAFSLQSLGIDLRVTGRHRDALVIDTEAVQIRRKLAETDPTVILNLTHSLHHLSVNLGAVGRNEDAGFAAEEAADLYLKQNQTVQTQLNLANVLVHWATYLRALNREEDSVQMCEKGVVIYRKLSETEPESTAGNLLLLARDLCVARLHEDALRAADQSIELYRGLTPAKLALTKDLIEALGCRAKSLRALGREEDAARAEAEMATLEEPAIEVAEISTESSSQEAEPLAPSESHIVSEADEEGADVQAVGDGTESFN